MKPTSTPNAVPVAAPMTEQDKLIQLVRGGYDMQKLRIATGNRLCAAFFTKLGIAPGEKQDKDDEAKSVLDQLKLSYKKITDGVKRELPTMRHFKGDSIISTYTELCLVHSYLKMETEEDAHFRRVGNLVEQHPLWQAFFADVRGCGPMMAGYLLSVIDIHKAEYPSSLWQYSGYSTAGDGRGTSRRKEHLRKYTYKTKDGKEEQRDGITFNPELKTKLHVLCTCFIKAGGKYRDEYDNYKHRLEHSSNITRTFAPGGKGMVEKPWSEVSPGHRHAAAMRYAIKRFLCDLYVAWRTLEGLPVAPEYSEAKLGKTHKKAA